MAASQKSNTQLSKESEKADFRSGYVTIVGPANAGKSTLLNAILGKKVSIVSPKEQTTRNRILGVKTGSNYQIVFQDTPGFDVKLYRGALSSFVSDEISEASRDSDVTVLTVDAAKLSRNKSLLDDIAKLAEDVKIKTPDIIALNKIDLLQRDRLLPLIAEIDQWSKSAAQSNKIVPELVPLSAKKGEGINVLLDLIGNRLPHGPQYFPADEITDQPEDFFVSEIIREKLFRTLNQELPYSIAVQVEAWDEDKDCTRIAAVVVVERDSQKGIVIGKGGVKLREAGKAARIELERAFGIKIFLELRVRVDKGWTKSKPGIVRRGYR